VNLIIRRRKRAGALAAAVAAMAVVALSAAAPAHADPAGLSGTDWTQATLPSGNYVGNGQNGNPIAPVSATVTVHGTNFRHVTAVDFGAAVGKDVRVLSSTELKVRAPAAKAGAAYVMVRTRNGGPSPLTGRSVFSFLPRPDIKTLSPSSGRSAGGNTVVIHGLELADVRSIYFGTHKAAHLTVLSASEIKVTAPAGNGKVRVTVVTAGGRSRPVPGDVYSY
jgi:IPT/TIG domain